MPTYGCLLPTRGSVLTSDDDQTLAAKTSADVVGLARRAETLGFDSVWVGDSVLARPRHEPLSTLAAIAGATDAVDLGTAVYLPTLRKPVTVAHMAATVDQLSGGRLRLGVGAASAQPDVEAEHANLDVPFENRGDRLNELLEIVTGLWTEGSVTHQGEFYDVADADLGFGPVCDPPIYVPTGSFDPDRGLPATIRERLVDHGDGCLPNVLSPERYAASLDYVYGLLEDAGRDAETFDPAYYLDVCIADDEETALAEARAFYDRYYADRPDFSDEEIRQRGAFGTRSAVAERIDAYADAGVETIVVRFVTGAQRRTLQRFADLL